MILGRMLHGPKSLTIDNWVMSCRVFGRQLEIEAMNIVVEEVAVVALQTIYADYIPTTKNKVINELYPSLGFTRVMDADADKRRNKMGA